MLVSGTVQTRYATEPSDLRVNIPSGVLVLGDGTNGGGPLQGINYGIAASPIVSTERPSGIQGDSLQAMMNQFPAYSRISYDPASVGAQILAAVSDQADELLQERDRWFFQQFAAFYPTSEQGVISEYDFSSYTNLNEFPRVQARLGSTWFEVGVTRDENWFWQSPPTRLETTTSEISGVVLKDWTQLAGSGLVDLGVAVDLPVFNYLYISVSGAKQFSTAFVDESDELSFDGYIEVRGYWSTDTLRHQRERVERLNVLGNRTFSTINRWRRITSVKTNGMDARAYVKVACMNFNNELRPDTTSRDFVADRDEFPEFAVWQLGGGDTTFSSVIQTEEVKDYDAADETWLFKTREATDRISDQDVEYHVVDWWHVTKPDGTALSGVVDFVQVPWTHHLLLLTNQSEAYVVDTYKPALDMSSFQEKSESPARIEAEYPLSSEESPRSFRVLLNARTIRDNEAVSSYRWVVHHDNVRYAIDTANNLVAWSGTAGWRNNSTVNSFDETELTLSGVGQYTFELESVTLEGNRYRTYSALQVTEKRALGALPINGLSAAPSGIDIDQHGRPWVTDGQTAVRLVMRHDIGTWSVDESVFLSREPYDEVRQL